MHNPLHIYVPHNLTKTPDFHSKATKHDPHRGNLICNKNRVDRQVLNVKEKTGYGKIKVPNNLLSAIDAVVGTLGYRTRAEFVNESIRTALKDVAKVAWHLKHSTRQAHQTGFEQTPDVDLKQVADGTGDASNRARLEVAIRRVDAIRGRLDDATKKGNKACIDLQTDLLKRAFEDVDYWSDVVAGKR